MSARKALISYSHKDERHRTALLSALANLVRSGAIEVWSDHQILPGQDIDDQILAQLREAEVVFLLVSPDFIASDYCYKKELQMALERHENGRAVVVPIVIRPTDMHGAPFARLLMLPTDAQAVTSWSNVDEAWLSVAHGVRRLLDQMPSEVTQAHVFSTKGIEQCLFDVFEQLQARFENPDVYRSARFGFSLEEFDDLVDGVWPGEWMVLASRPEHGHVELGHALILDAAIKGEMKVFVLSQRHSSHQFTNRLLCNLGRVSRFQLTRGALDDESWSRLTASIRMLKGADMTIDDRPIRSLMELKGALSLISEGGYDVVLIDGLEYLNGGSDERAISLAISDFSKQSKAAVIGTLSLGDEAGRRAYKKPMLADLGEWRALENFSQKIVLCFRGDAGWDSVPDALSTDCELILAKSSHGVTGAFSARYFYEYGVVNGVLKGHGDEG